MLTGYQVPGGISTLTKSCQICADDFVLLNDGWRGQFLQPHATGAGMWATALYAERVAAAPSTRAQPSITSCRSSESKTQHAGECVRTAILEPMPVIGVGSGISNPGKVRPLSRGKAAIAGKQIAAPEHGTADAANMLPRSGAKHPLQSLRNGAG